MNDPFFSQMFLVYSLVILISLAPIAKSVFCEGQPEYQFYSSLKFRVFLFFISQQLKMIESSLLTLLITNYIIFCSFDFSK